MVKKGGKKVSNLLKWILIGLIVVLVLFITFKIFFTGNAVINTTKANPGKLGQYCSAAAPCVTGLSCFKYACVPQCIQPGQGCKTASQCCTKKCDTNQFFFWKSCRW
jgi:hypothetical protein